MNTSLMISTGAIQTYQQKLDTVSNNVANANTVGFKRREHSFSEILASQINNQGRPNEETGRLTPEGIRVGYGTRTGMTQLDLNQGVAKETENPFDLMINGNGFFQIGVGGETRYTRDGNLHLSPNPDGSDSYHLVHNSGGYLLDQTGNPIILDGDMEVKITDNGQIQLQEKGGQGNTFLSGQRIGIVDIANPQLLRNEGGNLLSLDGAALPDGAGAGEFVRLMGEQELNLASGFLEGSNVDLSKEMTDLMMSQRSFQLNSRAVTYADQMLGIANNILR